MALDTYGLGDMVWSTGELHNDGTIPDIADDALLATPGARGVVVKVGHLEQQPEVTIYLVRFEDKTGVLGPPVGCTIDELTQDEAHAKSLRPVGPSARDEGV